MRLLGLERHYRLGKLTRNSAVDYLRIVSPLQYLSKITDWTIDIRKDPFDKKDKRAPADKWLELTKDWDIIYTSYPDNAAVYSALRVGNHHYGSKTVIDVDDNLWEVPKSNPVFSWLHYGTKSYDKMSKIIEDAEYVTCTNNFLKDRIFYWTKRDYGNTYVLPNYIDLNYYKDGIASKKRDTIIIGYFGGWTHLDDITHTAFISAIRRIMKEFDNVEIHTCGMYAPHFEREFEKRYTYIGGKPDYFKWVKVWQNLDFDFVVVPLDRTTFTKCKSDIKWQEASAHGWTGVYEGIRQYNKVVAHGSDGFLADSEDNWYDYMKFLIQNEKERVKMGKKALKSVQDYSMKKNVIKYKEFFESIYE
jgi:glycosyltransferase involved in cell wall biosynthesis